MNFFMGGGFPALATGQTGTPATTTNMNAAAAAAAMYGMNPQQQATPGGTATTATPMVNPFAAAATGTTGVQSFNLNPSVAAAATYNPYQQAFNQSMMAAAAASQQNYAAYMAAANFQQQMSAAAAASANSYKGNVKQQTQTSVSNNSRQYPNGASNQNTSGSNDTSNVSSTSFSASPISNSKTSSYSTSGTYSSGGSYSKPYNSYSSGSGNSSSNYSSSSSSRYSGSSNSSSSRNATGSNSHPVSYNKTLTGGENNFDRNSSGSFYRSGNSGNNASNSYTSPTKVGYVPNKTSSTSNSGPANTISSSSSSGSSASNSNNRQNFSSSNDSSSYQRRWNNYSDRNQSYSSGGGGGNREGGGGNREGGGGSREGGGGSREGGSGYREGGGGGSSHGNYVPRGPLHYCDVCKISCAGPQTYKEHLEGQKHKKKEQQLKAGIVPEQNQPQQQQHFKPGQKTFYCELCDVTCTSADTYNAHARGAKHLKCVKLYQKMNKPIPPAKEVIVNAAGEEPTVVTHKVSQEQPARGYSGGGFGGNKFGNSGSSGNYSGNDWNRGGNYGNRSFGSSNGSGEKETASSSTTLKGLSSKITPVSESVKSVIDAASSTTYVEDGLLKDECDPEPVGGEYIEETRCHETNKLIEFNCKLCDCKFNDPHAKDMHLKGRRHRIMYKRKVNPDLEVEVKPGFRNKKLMEDRERSRRQREFLHRRLAEDHYSRMQMRRMEEELYFRVPAASLGSTSESWDDRHIMAKHAAIYPSDEELEAVQLIVGRAEKVLKVVSDKLALEDMKDPDIRKRVLAGKTGPVAATETTKSNATKETEKSSTASESSASSETKSVEKSDESDKTKPDEIDSAFRQVKGVMRIGALAKGLLLRGDKLVELAVLCQDRPTKTLLARIFKSLSQQMGELTSDKYSYEVKVQDCAILMTSQEDNYKIQLKASLTSPAVEVEEESSEGSDADAKPTNPNLLSKTRCLSLLGELRRAKWFQTRAASVPACVVVTRILRDLIRRNPNWEQLPLWTMEVLVERTLGANQVPLSPGDALRRVFESISGGVLACREHSIGVGLVDPCENEVVDVTEGMKLQCREDVTASAQQALRQMVFKQINKVLGMDLVSPPTQAQIRKRRMEQMEMMNKARGEQNVNSNVTNRPPPANAGPPLSAGSVGTAVVGADGPNPAKKRFQDDAPGRTLPHNEKPIGEKDAKSELMETNSSVNVESNETANADATAHMERPDQEIQNRSKSESEIPEFGSSEPHQDASMLSSSYDAVQDSTDAPTGRNENLVDPGGEAAYEAMSYEDPYESYYGPLPQYQNRMPFGGGYHGNPRFFRPWRGGGHPRGGFYNRPPW